MARTGLRLLAWVTDVHVHESVSEITRAPPNREPSSGSLQIEEPPIAVKAIASDCSRMQDSEELTPSRESRASEPSRSNTCQSRVCEARTPSISEILGGTLMQPTLPGERLRTGLANVNCQLIFRGPLWQRTGASIRPHLNPQGLESGLVQEKTAPRSPWQNRALGPHERRATQREALKQGATAVIACENRTMRWQRGRAGAAPERADGCGHKSGLPGSP